MATVVAAPAGLPNGNRGGRDSWPLQGQPRRPSLLSKINGGLRPPGFHATNGHRQNRRRDPHEWTTRAETTREGTHRQDLWRGRRKRGRPTDNGHRPTSNCGQFSPTQPERESHSCSRGSPEFQSSGEHRQTWFVEQFFAAVAQGECLALASAGGLSLLSAFVDFEPPGPAHRQVDPSTAMRGVAVGVGCSQVACALAASTDKFGCGRRPLADSVLESERKSHSCARGVPRFQHYR